MRRATLCTLAFVLVWTMQLPSAQQPDSAIVPGLVSTWTLTSLERGAGGQTTRIANPRGLLVLDGAGHAFEFVSSPAGQRAPDGGPVPQTQAADPLERLASYGGFWGEYSVDATQKRLILRPAGAVHPQMMGGRTFSRTLEIQGDRLTLTSIDEPQTPAGTRWVWDRVPTLESLSPVYRRVVGFWEHVVEKRVNGGRGTGVETRRQPSVIVYTPGGFVGVHFLPANRKPFAGSTPTPEEARAALQGYIGYYGALTVYSGLVFHNILGGISPTPGTILRRFADISGDELTVRLPPGRAQDGQETNTIVTLKRLSGVDEMLPRP
jgi:hypothetical protein